MSESPEHRTQMAIEIAEAPDVVARTLAINSQALNEVGKLFREKTPSYFVTCARGSSDHAATYFKYLTEIYLGIPCCSAGLSSVSIYKANLRLRDTILVSISQSGRSPDLLAYQTEARRAGVPTIAVTNDLTSPLADDASICLPLNAGQELGVAATKTFIASAALAAALSAECEGSGRLRMAIKRLPEDLARACELHWRDVEDAIADAQSVYILGRGPSLAMAQEAALKLKETCGIHAEAFSTAEVMHGPMELVRKDFPIVLFAPDDAALPTTLACMKQLKDAGALVVQPSIRRTLHTALDPISMIQSFYRSSEALARARGRNPDAPKMLSKITKTL